MTAPDVERIERPFLPAEFLTWLWYRCEDHGGTFELEGGDFALAIDDALQLASWEEEGCRAAFKGGPAGPTTRPEAARALAEGLLLAKARFVAARGVREWSFSLDYRLDLIGVKVADPEDEGESDPLAEKLFAAQELRVAIEKIYRGLSGSASSGRPTATRAPCLGPPARSAPNLLPKRARGPDGGPRKPRGVLRRQTEDAPGTPSREHPRERSGQCPPQKSNCAQTRSYTPQSSRSERTSPSRRETLSERRG